MAMAFYLWIVAALLQLVMISISSIVISRECAVARVGKAVEP